jgi:hypothetical protein
MGPVAAAPVWEDTTISYFDYRVAEARVIGSDKATVKGKKKGVVIPFGGR